MTRLINALDSKPRATKPRPATVRQLSPRHDLGVRQPGWYSPDDANERSSEPNATNSDPAEILRQNLSDGVAARQFESLAEHIHACCGQRPAVLLFAGVDSASHVTDTLAHVGWLLASRHSHRTLVIDGHASMDSLSHRFLLAAMSGFTDVLEHASDERAIHSIVHNLDLLPYGLGGTPQGMDLCNSASFLLHQLRSRYQFVMIDAGSQVSELAESLARICDGTFLVVRLGKTDSVEAHSAVTRLRRAGARVKGCVVTNLAREPDGSDQS